MSRPYIVASFDDDNLKTSASRAIVEDAKRKVLEGDVDKDGFLQQFGRVPAPDYAIVSNVFHVVIGINLIVLAVLEQQLIHDPETMAFVLKLIVDVLFEPGVGRVVSQALTATDNNIQSLATRIGYAFTTQTSDSDAIASSVRHHLRPLVPRLAGAVHASEIAYRVNTQPAPNLNPEETPCWSLDQLPPVEILTCVGRVLSRIQRHFEKGGADHEVVLAVKNITVPCLNGEPSFYDSTSDRCRRLTFVGREAIWPYCILHSLFSRGFDVNIIPHYELSYDVLRHDRFASCLVVAFECLQRFSLYSSGLPADAKNVSLIANVWYFQFADDFLNGQRGNCLRFVDELLEVILPIMLKIIQDMPSDDLIAYTTTNEFRARRNRGRILEDEELAIAVSQGHDIAPPVVDPQSSTGSKKKKSKKSKTAQSKSKVASGDVADELAATLELIGLPMP